MTLNYETYGTNQFLDPSGHLANLANLSDLYMVLEELQIEENSEHWNTLLDSKRELVKMLNADVKLNSTKAKLKSCKLYFFNDMFIIGQYKKSKRSKKTMSPATSGTVDKVVFGDLIGRKESEGDMFAMNNGFNTKDEEELKLEIAAALQENGSQSPGMSTSSASLPRPRATMKKGRSLRKQSQLSQGSGRSFQTMQSDFPKLKIKLWMDLEHIDFRQIQENGEFGIRCFCTIQQTIEDEDTGELQYVTDVQQVQFFLGTQSEQEKVFQQLIATVDGYLERKIALSSKVGDDQTSIGDFQTDAGSVVPDIADDATSVGDDATMDASASAKMQKMMATMRKNQVKQLSPAMRTLSMQSNGTASTGRSKKRSYAKGKDTMRKLKANRYKKKTTGIGSGTLEAITLDDLVERYKVVLSPDEQNETAQFSVTFGPGPMGFALSSTKEVKAGVFVGKLESGGMAEIGGVTLGDRLVAVNNVDVRTGKTWQDCISIIKVKRGEIDENGNSKKLILHFARTRSVEENISRKREEEKKKKIKERIKKRGGKRAWTKRKQKSFGSRMGSLNDIKDKYTSKHDVNELQQEKCDDLFESLLASTETPTEKKCGHILKEIHDTEKSYVSSLYSLIDHYLKALQKKKVEVPCKEIGGGVTKFCEHQVSRLLCNRISSTKLPILSKKEAKTVFGNVELLVKINESLLGSLQKGLVNLHTKHEARKQDITVADVVLVYAPVFSQIMPFFRIYSQYAYQYSNALEELNILKEREQFRNELDRIEAKRGVSTLNGLLIKPIARLCKYPLLFATLNDNVQTYITETASKVLETGSGNIDKLDKCLNELLEASQIVADIAESVDVKVGTSQDLEKLSEIYQELGGHKGVKQFMVPSRRYIGKYEVFIEDKSQKKSKLKQHWLYLFNDLVVFATEKTGTFFGILEGGGSLVKFGTRRKGTFEGSRSTLGNRTVVDDNKSKVSHSSKRNSTTRNNSVSKKEVKQLVNVKKQIKIDFVNIRKRVVPNKEQMHGISFTETERKVSVVKKSRKNPEEREEQHTNIHRYEVWCVTEEERDELLTKMSEQVRSHKKKIRAKKRVNAKLKPDLKRKQRQWKSKARRLREKSMLKLEKEEKKKSEFIVMDIENGTPSSDEN